LRNKDLCSGVHGHTNISDSGALVSELEFSRKDRNIDILIYLLTAVVLTQGGSCTVHNYTQNNKQNNTVKQNTQNSTHITIKTHNITIKIHNLQNYTEAYKAYKHIYKMIKNGTKIK